MTPDDEADVLDHEGARVLLRLPSLPALHYLRRKGVIPHRRLSYRAITYSKRRLLEAMEKREIKEKNVRQK